MMSEVFQSMSFILFLDVKCQISLNFTTRLRILCRDVNFNFTFQFFMTGDFAKLFQEYLPKLLHCLT